ncbi:unnamed protein product [Allacma fusca]|uniref:non-specific serine/threonine protein kinase n=1 Tax=Allacma fusca TaxID=39272 RepID=A0A8J2L890_9HEXA|nr:unnamed protein product [Allacma fusca]
MQQVFGVMNQLFAQEPRTRKKRLHIRTYKVVPLSQRSGVLEWCENTQTFGDYLVGSNPPNFGAHAHYRPNDYHPNECRLKMQNKRSCGVNSMKLDVFNEIIANFKPVFHHFFFENFKDAGSFFERRLAYTRSVATSSIVGYILGLGDRHVQNILIDKSTAEVIHIDFGVAFDQGKLLPTPETIPFRLTRDIVDGMGFCGIEGVFRRSCESTMEVLRKNADIIVTILEVLLYDPLYLWTLSEEHKHKLQSEDRSQAVNSRYVTDLTTESETKTAERNNTAARELRRLRCKLAGIQEGRTSGYTMTVPGHVSQLISFAQDTSLLSRLYPGWQPYL